MKVCLKVPLSRDLHDAEASQLIFIKRQMTGLHMAQNLTKKGRLKSPELFKIVKYELKLLNFCIKILYY